MPEPMACVQVDASGWTRYLPARLLRKQSEAIPATGIGQTRAWAGMKGALVEAQLTLPSPRFSGLGACESTRCRRAVAIGAKRRRL